ncbi:MULTISPECIES: hypothetical protein [unclassified Variovorax]|uniref:hypothetical protein n=1 Tax=unclassified Variovorax TaxID=663243 RepID=UPI00210EAD42|nr:MULTISPECIES: hypothetical protein [unclassified Variovorax]
MGDLALTVEERGQGRFFWVVLQATTGDSQDEMVYRRLRTAEESQTSYSSALAVGSLMLRRLTGNT